MGPPAWTEIATAFRAHHTHPLNVALHLLTTPLAVTALTAAVVPAIGIVPAALLHGLWILSLALLVPSRFFAASAVLQAWMCAAGIYLATVAAVPPLLSLLMFVVAYFAQDGAHWVVREQTFQSSYLGKPGFAMMLFWHTICLVPLCLDACFHTANGSLASIVVQRKQVPYAQLQHVDPALLDAAKAVGVWAAAQNPPEHRTSHWWVDELDSATKAAFCKVARSTDLMATLFGALFPSPSHVVEPLEGMNEVYVACKTHNSNSDTVFYMNHVDGPYGLFPFVHVYRCMCAATPNQQIETIFPLQSINDSCRYTLTEGDIVGFDFHRELHRIGLVEGSKENEGIRACLKLHYLVYPRALAPLGRLLGRMTVHYNQNFRALFLATIEPGTLLAKFMAWWVRAGTAIFNSIEGVLGWANLSYLLGLALLALVARTYTVFFVGTSFMHYLVYMGTYHQRVNIAYCAWKRDALLYKTLALMQAGLQFVFCFDYSAPDFVSIGLCAFGFGLAFLATLALGVDRTYFGWELGEINGDCVRRFPYGFFPHPMILGGIVSWLGFHKLDGFRSAWPYYVPLHVAFYVCHATQEHCTVHTTGLLQKGGKLQ